MLDGVLDRMRVPLGKEAHRIRSSEHDVVPWIECPVVTTPVGPAQGAALDDHEVELAIYKQSLWGIRQALRNFDKAGVRVQRPDDYFAEMVKSDEHMMAVKDRQLREIRFMKESEERAKMRRKPQDREGRAEDEGNQAGAPAEAEHQGHHQAAPGGFQWAHHVKGCPCGTQQLLGPLMCICIYVSMDVGWDVG